MQKPSPMSRSLPLAAAGLFLALSACGGSSAPPAQPPAPPPPVAAPRAQSVTFAELERTIFSPKCLSCHQSPNGKSGVNLDSYAAIQSAPTTHGHAIVQPGNSSASYLF